MPLILFSDNASKQTLDTDSIQGNCDLHLSDHRVGQLKVMGKRISYGFCNRTRPHFNKDELTSRLAHKLQIADLNDCYMMDFLER